jgi:NAD(P)-dependent dehydrogenase (short-subunit alcohol dehydrogenase family)
MIKLIRHQRRGLDRRRRPVLEPIRRGKERSRAMTDAQLTVLVVGASGRIGRLVVDAALRRRHRVRALVRRPAGFHWPPDVASTSGDLLRHLAVADGGVNVQPDFIVADDTSSAAASSRSCRGGRSAATRLPGRR